MTLFWWRHQITSPKLRHQNFPFSSPPPLSKSWLRPCLHRCWSRGEPFATLCKIWPAGL